MAGVIIERLAPTHPDAVAVRRAYMVEIVGRYYDRPTSDTEIDDLMVEYADDDLAAPSGLFLVVRDGEGGAVIGCAGLRRLDPQTTELTRMFVYPEARRRGIASLLIAAAEDAARELGVTTMRLDTRKDLVAARALYRKHGYVEIQRYNDDFYADHWFEKPLV